MKKSSIFTCILCILFYLLLLFLYLQNVIDELLFLFILLISLIILIIMFIVFRKKHIKKRMIAIAATIILVLFCYELPLLGFATQSHIAYVYLEPKQTVEGTGIFLLGVSALTFDNMESKQVIEEKLIKEQEEVLTIIELSNHKLYENKNRTILGWLNLNGESPKEKMREHLKQYFGKEEPRLTDYFSRDKGVGDSSGLGILLTELIIMGDLQNSLPIAVTGKINGEGDVSAIGNLKEKIQIAEKSGFQFMIIPSENAKEAMTLQKELKTNIEIFDVDHVDEAVEQINYLNEEIK